MFYNFSTFPSKIHQNCLEVEYQVLLLHCVPKLNFEFRQQRLVEDSQLIDNTRRFVANYQFAQRMYLRSSLEQTLQNESRFFALFAYEYQPESNFFIVYNYNQKKKFKINFHINLVN